MSEVKVTEIKKVIPFEGRIPAFWSVQPAEDAESDNLIEARNSATGETFNGTIDDFNARLKG